MEDIKVLKKRAKKDSDAMYMLGMYYKNGYMTKCSLPKAIDCFTKVADKNSKAAEERIAIMLYIDYEYDYIERQCIELVNAEGDEKNPNGYSYLAELYLCNTQHKKAHSALKTADNEGATASHYVWGTLYRDGFGVDKDPNKAYEYFVKSAEAGDYRGQMELGVCYMQGLGCEKNVDKALEYLGMASESADRNARLYLARCILENNVEEEYFEAIDILKYYDKKCSADYIYCDALRYICGAGVKKDPMKAFKILDKHCKNRVKHYLTCDKDIVLKVLDCISTGEMKLPKKVQDTYSKYLVDIEKEEMEIREELSQDTSDDVDGTIDTISTSTYVPYYHQTITTETGVDYFDKMHTFARCPKCGCEEIQQRSSINGKTRKESVWVHEGTGSYAFTSNDADYFGQTITTEYTCTKCAFEWERTRHEIHNDENRDSLFGKSITDIYSTVTIKYRALKPCSKEVEKRLKKFEGKYKYKWLTTKV